MSFTHTPLKSTRLNRSELFIPGSKPELFPKAVNSKADVICIDLEDAVAPQDKDQAKKNLIQALFIIMQIISFNYLRMKKI